MAFQESPGLKDPSGNQLSYNGYENYKNKHLTLINRHTCKVIAKYSGDQVKVVKNCVE